MNSSLYYSLLFKQGLLTITTLWMHVIMHKNGQLNVDYRVKVIKSKTDCMAMLYWVNLLNIAHKITMHVIKKVESEAKCHY